MVWDDLNEATGQPAILLRTAGHLRCARPAFFVAHMQLALEGIRTTRVMISNITIESVPEHLSETQNLVLRRLGVDLPKQKVLSAGMIA